jgi:hypothetical protein
MNRLGDLRGNVEAGSINVEKYLKELSVVTIDLTKARVIMFEQKQFRLIATFSATRTSGGGGGGFRKGVMEHMVIMNLSAVNGDKSSF